MPDIMELAISGKFTKWVEAVTAAGLVDTLKGPGPFTVFAPTDDAFNKLSIEFAKGLLKDPPKAKNILLYHVVPGKVMAEEIGKMNNVKTVQGQELRIEPPKGLFRKNAKVNGANIVKTDIIASNGVCHAIDFVLMPK
jgi:uncharacterized surface protein with fasciclin (FAS1) repeats